MIRSIHHALVAAWLAVKPAVMFAVVAATPANAGVEEVVRSVEGSQDSLWKLAGGLIVTLAAYIWKRERKEFDEYKKIMEEQHKEFKRQFEVIGMQIAGGIKPDYFREQQTSIHNSIDRLRGDIERARMEDLRNTQTTFQEIWNDMKDQRGESQRISQEVFHQISSSRERMQAHEVTIAQRYHTKDEISDLMQDKLNPVMEQLRRMSDILSNPNHQGFRRRSTDHT